MSAITIIDYGMGNLRSVQKAIEKCGAEATISADPREIANAEKVILPGVGAFRDAIEALRQHDMISMIHDVVAADKPFLGICLGLQLLFETSYEDGEFEGLGIIPGKVVKFDLPAEFKIPHMGWNQLSSRIDGNPLMNNISAEAWFYFVHSYYVVPTDDSWTAGRTDYGGQFTSMIKKNNVLATQFHPEKSQTAGLQLLKNFVEM